MPKVLGCVGLLASSLVGASFASAQQPARKSTAADTAVASQPLRLYFSPIRVDSGYRLTPNGYSGATHVQQIVDFADRRDSARVSPVIGTVARAIDTWNGVQFVSPQLAGPFELTGPLSGHLDFITNDDFDFQISLYELTSKGDYFLVSTYSTQDSAVRDTSKRTSLEPGVRQHLDYQSGLFNRHIVQNGSRLVLLITILRRAEIQIDGSTGRENSRTLADMTEPLRVSWYGESYIALHVRRR